MSLFILHYILQKVNSLFEKPAFCTTKAAPSFISASESTGYFKAVLQKNLFHRLFTIKEVILITNYTDFPYRRYYHRKNPRNNHDRIARTERYLGFLKICKSSRMSPYNKESHIWTPNRK